VFLVLKVLAQCVELMLAGSAAEKVSALVHILSIYLPYNGAVEHFVSDFVIVLAGSAPQQIIYFLFAI
jgi:hypothetical protein